MSFTIKSDGKEFTFRNFTDEEAIKIQEKRINLSSKNHSAFDDGEKEILKTLISDNEDDLKELASKYPNLHQQLFYLQLENAGIFDVELIEPDEEQRAKYNFPIVLVKWGEEEPVLWKKIPKTDVKIISKETVLNGDIVETSKLCSRIKSFCLEKEKATRISEKYPLFYISVSMKLWAGTFASLEIEKKS